MLSCYFIRHAESTANAEKVLASHLPYPLSARGRKDASAGALNLARQVLEGRSIRRIIASPLIRACQTAEPYADFFSLPIEQDERLVEQHLGIFSGMSYSEAEAHPLYESRRDKRWDWVPAGGGESYRMIAGRIGSFLSELAETEKSVIADPCSLQPILIVSHAVTLRMIYAHLADSLPEYPAWIAQNGEIWEVNFTGLGTEHTISRYLPGDPSAPAHQE